MARPNYSGEKRRKELEKQKKKEEKKRRKLEHASLPAKSEEVIEASEPAPEDREIKRMKEAVTDTKQSEAFGAGGPGLSKVR